MSGEAAQDVHDDRRVRHREMPNGEYYNVLTPDFEVCAEHAEWLLNDWMDGWGMFAKVTVKEEDAA